MKNKKQIRKEQKEKLFQLFDSFIPINIDLGITIMNSDQGFKAACKHRYYPLMRFIDPSLGQGFQLLKEVGKALNQGEQHIYAVAIIHYKTLGAITVAEELEARFQAHTTRLVKDNPSIFSLSLLAQLVNNPSLKPDSIKSIYLQQGQDAIPLPTDRLLFQGLEELSIDFTSYYSMLEPYFSQMTSLELFSAQRCNIAQLPIDFIHLLQLKHIDLRSNQLKVLPQEMKQLQQISSLYLCDNQFSKLPKTLQYYKELSNLWACRLQLQELPVWLLQLSQLHTLYLDGNQLKNATALLFALPALKHLHLRNNQLTTIVIDPEKHSTSITALNIGSNLFSDFPTALLHLKNLHSLDMERCQLTALPETIYQLKQLDHLYLSGNNLTRLPETIGQLQKLEWLTLDNNPLEQLPNSIGQLTKLHGLSVRASNITTIPTSIQQLRQPLFSNSAI
ncbi:MAG: leucine-rich repeat domain-containing protein [Aureispira sp.]